jgi:glycosyltransferase involved in cell wall biosynthesis
VNNQSEYTVAAIRAGAPLCSVVIPTRERHEQLDRALRSVANLEYSNYETLIIDNSRGDESVRCLAEQWGARLIVEPRRGVSFARNRGALESRGEIVAFLDDDAVADSGWLGALVAEFADPAVMMVSGPYLPLESTVYAASYNPGAARRVLDRATLGWMESAAFGRTARGGNMALRGSVFQQWEGFEPELGRGTPLRAFPWSEVLACGSDDCYAVLQIVERGYKFVYTPDALVRHPFPHTVDELRAFHFRMLRGWGLYAGFLVTHGYGGAVLKYARSRFRGKRLRNARRDGISFPIKTNEARELFAALKGLILYFRIELARKLYRLDSPVLSMQPNRRDFPLAT